jgi:hypothetical protein
MLARHQAVQGVKEPMAVKAGPPAPTFAALRSVEAVDAQPRMSVNVEPEQPVARAGERPDSQTGRELANFK